MDFDGYLPGESGPGSENTSYTITHPRRAVWLIRQEVLRALAVSSSHLTQLQNASQAPQFITRWARDRSLLQHELDAFIYAAMRARPPGGLPPPGSRASLPLWLSEQALASPVVGLRLLRAREVASLLDISEPTLHRYVAKDRSFAQPLAVGVRATRWVFHEVEALARRGGPGVLDDSPAPALVGANRSRSKMPLSLCQPGPLLGRCRPRRRRFFASDAAKITLRKARPSTGISNGADSAMIRAPALSERTAPAICRCCEPGRRRCRPRFARRVVRRSPRAGTRSLRRVRPPRADSGRAVRGCASRVCTPGYGCSDAPATVSLCGVKRGQQGTVPEYTVSQSRRYARKRSPRSGNVALCPRRFFNSLASGRPARPPAGRGMAQ